MMLAWFNNRIFYAKVHKVRALKVPKRNGRPQLWFLKRTLRQFSWERNVETPKRPPLNSKCQKWKPHLKWAETQQANLRRNDHRIRVISHWAAPHHQKLIEKCDWPKNPRLDQN